MNHNLNKYKQQKKIFIFSKLLTKKRIINGFIIILGIIIVWYIIVRLISPWTVVKNITLIQDNPLSINKPFDELKVGCYNIAHGRGGLVNVKNWEGGNKSNKIKRLNEIAKILKNNELDIVVLNEIDFSSFWSGHKNQARIIANEAGFPYIIEQRNINIGIPFINLKYGNAILSKYPFSDCFFIDYPNTSEFIELLIGGFKEGVIGTIILPDKSSIQVAAIHLSVNSESTRISSINMILEQYQQSKIPILLMGDFNTAPKGYPQYHVDENGQNTIEVLLNSKQFTNNPPGFQIPEDSFTFPSEKPARIIDWIFISSPWHIHEQKVVKTNLSDHFPVKAILTKENKLE